MLTRTSELSLRSGLAFIATSKVQGLAVGAQRLRAIINNPSGSNRNIVLSGVVVDNNLSGMLWAALQYDPTNGPSGAGNAGLIANQNFGSSRSSIATVFSDSASTQMDGTNIANFGLPGGVRTVLDEVSFILTPGHSLGFDASFTALVSVAKAGLMVYWQEEVIQ